MRVLGMRCSKSDYSYCVVDGTHDSPVVAITKQVTSPRGYEQPETLRWLYQEMEALFKAQAVEAVGIKKAEPTVKRSNSLEERIQNEAIVSLAAAEAGLSQRVERKVKATIAKDLGLKGKAKYLETKLDTSAIPGFDKYPDKVQEAILVAWSCMT